MVNSLSLCLSVFYVQKFQADVFKFQAKLCLKKAVLISVYEEKPTKIKDHRHKHHHHHHHHYVYHSIQQDKGGDQPTGKGYNRRAELLLYSQRLRQSVRPAESSHLLDTKPVSSNIQQPAVKVSNDNSILYIYIIRRKFQSTIEISLYSCSSFSLVLINLVFRW